jgi:hypothetical protein
MLKKAILLFVCLFLGFASVSDAGPIRQFFQRIRAHRQARVSYSYQGVSYGQAATTTVASNCGPNGCPVPQSYVTPAAPR